MAQQKQGFISRLFGKITPDEVVSEITQNDAMRYGAIPSSISTAISTGGKALETRNAIYSDLAIMEANSIISTATRLVSTAALGGHETTGQIVFVELKPEFANDAKSKKIVEGINDSLVHIFNRVAFQLAYTGSIYGDAYARINTQKGKGVVDMYIGEQLLPQLVQPFERAGKTQGYAVYSGTSLFEKFSALQIGRIKMPRVNYSPQFGDIEKSLYSSLKYDDPDDWSLIPASAGGSLISKSKIHFDNLNASLVGITGQRLADSIDESILTVNMDGMTKEQREKFSKNITDILIRSQSIARHAIKNGKPVAEKIRHVIPVSNEKQLMQVGGAISQRSSPIQIDDIMLHAKLLSGSLGVDLSMLGFADLLSGGLGEGGFFRVSAQAAESGRVIRGALSDFFEHVIDVHLIAKGLDTFEPNKKPYQINFYGNISALESERQKTKLDAMASGMQLVQTMQQLKEMGADKEIMKVFLSKTMLVDEDLAETYAKIVDMQPPQPPQQDGFGNDGENDNGNQDDFSQNNEDDNQLTTDSVVNDIDYSDVIFDSVIGRQGDFITFNGSIDIGHLNVSGVEPAPIRLEVGNAKFGLIHIKNRHKEIYRLGFSRIEDFVYLVAKRYTQVRFTSDNKLMLVMPELNKGKLLIIKMQKKSDGKGRYWGVTTGYEKNFSTIIEKTTLIAEVNNAN